MDELTSPFKGRQPNFSFFTQSAYNNKIMRTLASIQTIDDIQPIDGADQIVVASVLGWKVVVKKGEFTIGQKIVYLEIDSWVPNTIAPFLSKGNEPREFEGVKGERLKTIRLRNQISQGLILPISVLPEHYKVDGKFVTKDYGVLDTGDDVTELLGIKKWEAPIAANLAGKVRGNFPSFLHKTDTDRIQSNKWILNEYKNITFRAYEKMDGSSCTVYHFNNNIGVCSRNLDLIETADNSFWQAANKYNLKQTLPILGNYAIQFELCGPGIQGNKYNLKELTPFVFDVYDINSGTYLNNDDALIIAQNLGLQWCPFVFDYTVFESTTVDELLSLAEDKSKINPNQEREGLVWRPLTETYHNRFGRVAFKTISNKFLLKGGD
jgi:RNA ligase (TIGR02306 family)